MIFTDTDETYRIEYMPLFEPPSLWVKKYYLSWKVTGGLPLPRNWGYIII